MSNELILFISAAVTVSMVFVAARLGTKWLFGIVGLNLILINIFGSKLIEVFGFVTNAGNIFYACAFLATHFLLERRDVRYARQTILFGVGTVIAFVALSQLAVALLGAPSGEGTQNALQTVFSFSPRIAIASMLAYIFAQHVNISLYAWLKVKTKDRWLWVESNGANIIAQLVDSSLFFTIAFLDLPGDTLLQAIVVGWVIKSFVVMLGVPFLYFDRYLVRRGR